MTFNDNANLDTSQVESGGSGGGGGGISPGGIGVGGIGGLIIMILMVLFGGGLTGGSGGGTTDQSGGGGLTQDTSQIGAAGTGGDAVSQQIASCKTGADANRDDTCRVIGTVNSVQNFWNGALPKYGQSYTPAKTVLYSGSTPTACGTGSAQMGPFYCPLDKKVYIDASFFQELSSKYGADDGALAQEYVVAHEYGHHVQDIFGVLGRAQQDPQGAESASVRTELQADCYAGIWVKYASQTKDSEGNTLLKPVTEEDIKSALSAASAVGDDRIQQKSQGRVTPESWTHGSSAQRQKWFLTGYQTGDVNSCDTFNAQDLG
ncbi:neutral zinc metallopeptidase [Luteipulveratus sp. YIM 133132]|uniref:Neutral zinc metallopeptidase n=1 Tax=Luteipulveratus flavus TaxID=3031728 RepID=A0ABT6C6R8_9MICO|nr:MULTISPECIES: neutral zinc metallopeptidase [unclassified Luteipulveratus]MDE9364488.1 neutral zinc metallopeptidase [Luteipulveratus sp. YIM 133132]MDF8264027.1 neutral zinc metallopeptidase [Luteipulveratus sp. YIM 133296]